MFKLASNWATAGVTLAARLELQFVEKTFTSDWSLLTSDPQSQSSLSSITPLPQVPKVPPISDGLRSKKFSSWTGESPTESQPIEQTQS